MHKVVGSALQSKSTDTTDVPQYITDSSGGALISDSESTDDDD